MLITVCVPSVRPDTVGATVASIRAQTHGAWEVVVVGQGDESSLRMAVTQAAAGDERVRYVHLEQFGACAARNRAMREARGEVFAFIDDDCEAAQDWLAQIVDRFHRHSAVGLIAGALVRPGPPSDSGRFKVCPEMIPAEIVYDPRCERESPPGFGAAGANLAIRRSIADRIGPFDERLGPGARFASTEDTDYIIRAEAAGTVLCSTPQAVVHHTNGYRFGVRAAYRLLRNYALGNGALAAKLTLAGDRRGHLWVRREIRATFVEPLVQRQPHRMPRRIVRLGFYLRGYASCRARCRVTGSDLATALLVDR